MARGLVTLARLPLLASGLLAGPALRAAPRRYAAAATRRYAAGSSGSGPAALEVLVPIADGSEEIETTCITDTLVRAGASVTVASVTGELTCTMSRGIRIVADKPIGECEGAEWAAVVLPGGMPGATHLRESAALSRILAAQAARDGALVAAVCASPAVALEPRGLLEGRDATGYPAPQFVEAIGARYVPDVPFVRDGDLITSRGPGTSLQFALALVDALYGREKADELAAQMLVAYPS